MTGAEIRACLEGDATYRRMYCSALWPGQLGEDVEQAKPLPSGALPTWANADRPEDEETGWNPLPSKPSRPSGPSMAERIAQIFDAIPSAPLAGPIAPGECVWCRITKKAAPWLGFIVVGLIVAWLSKKLIK